MSSQPYPVYAPQPTRGPFNASNDSLDMVKAPLDDPRSIMRTPSPTPEENDFLQGIRRRTMRQRIQGFAIFAVILTIVILISVFHEKIIDALQPFTDWMRSHTVGPLIPIVILIVLSFPPLFGHELVAMLAGVTWSFPAACAIVAVGTLLGELANYFVFRYACYVRGGKMEQRNLEYGLLAHVVRSGGFLIVLVVRYSAIPPHFATAVFSTVGIPLGTFFGAALLSLPKTFVPVYVGYALRPENEDDATSQKIEKLVLIAGIIVTIAAMTWIRRRMAAARPDYIYLRRKARQAKAAGAAHAVSLPPMV